MTNKLRLNLLINLKKYLIVIKENKNENRIAVKFIIVKFKLLDDIKSFKPNTDTAAKVGIDNRKDIFAESYLLKFNNLAAVIVIPDLLTPGINDII